MKETYFETAVMIERLHRLFLEVIKYELDQLKILDINNVQALILYNIGKNQLSVGELTHRGYYLGSNVSYNLRKMVLNGYVNQFQSAHDKRSSHVSLSQKGLNLYNKLDSLFGEHAKNISDQLSKGLNLDDLKDNFRKFEDFWVRLIEK